MTAQPLPDARLEQIHHSLTLEFRRVLSEAEWREVIEAARQLPYVQGLQAEWTDLAELTRLRAERDMLRGVGCLEDGDGPCGVCIKCLRVRAEAAEAALTEAKHRAYTEYEQRIDVQARLDLFKHQLSVQEARTESWHQAYDALHAQLEELKDCVCDWINEGLIVPDGRLSSMLASAPPAAPET